MLHPALLSLMKLQFRGRLRASVRGAKTPKGIVFLVVALIVLVLWLGPAIFSAFVVKRADVSIVRGVVPLALLALTIVTALAHGGDKAISFTPAEVNFLFPGPFTRRQLLLFKISKSMIGALLSALFFSLIMLRYGTLWAGVFVGAFLGMLFLQFASMAFVLTRQTAGEATSFATKRRAVLFVVLACAAVAVAPAVRAALRADWGTLISSVQSSTAAQVALAPIKPVAMAWTAPTYGQLALWTIVAAAVDGALLLLVLKLDANLVDVALEASRRQDEVLTRMKRGAWITPPASGSKRTTLLRVPMPPRMGGAGPVLWRQLATAQRASRGLLIFLGIFAVGIVPVAVIGGSKGGVWAVLPAVIWVTLILGAMLKLDFRGDLDRMDVLKSLPISPMAVAAGQLATPTIMLALIHILLIGGMLLFVPVNPAGGGNKVLLWALAIALPLDLLMIGVENLIFLLLPARPAAATPGDLSAMGRHALLFFLKGLVMLLACGLAAGAGAAAYFALGRSQVIACAVTVAVLSAAALAMVPLVGRTFDRFDPSVDVPA
jgi:hypothetical protein